MRIVDIRQDTVPISSAIRNAYIDFSKMTVSAVAIVTDVIRNGKLIIDNDSNQRADFESRVLKEYFDFSRFQKRYLVLPIDRTAPVG